MPGKLRTSRNGKKFYLRPDGAYRFNKKSNTIKHVGCGKGNASVRSTSKDAQRRADYNSKYRKYPMVYDKKRKK